MNSALSAVPVLDRFRHFSRRAWFLHAFLIASIIGLPSGAWRVQADTEGYEYDHMESCVSVSLSAPNGTTGIVSGAECPLVATVTLSSWEVWMDPNTFETESRNETSTPMSEASVQFSIEWGDGWLAGDSQTNSVGEANTTYTMGMSAASIRADVDFGGGMVGTGTLMFDAPAVESWSYDHQEGSYSVNISTDGDTAVASGDTRGLIIDVVYSSWDVEVSNSGGERISNYQSSPAIGASVWWAVDTGDGVVWGESSTDNGGFAVAEFTMGSSDAVVTAYVDYGGSSSASASQFFGFAQTEQTVNWYGPEYGGDYGVENLTFDGSTENLASGDVLAVTGTLMWYEWERWYDDYGNEQYTYYDPVPAADSNVSVGLLEGDGLLSTYSPATDSVGQFSFSITMGNESSQLCVDGPDCSGSGPIQWLTISNETWSEVGTETAYSVEMVTPASGSTTQLAEGEFHTLTAKVTAVDITTLMSDQGNWDYQYGAPYDVEGVPVEFNLLGLDGYLSSSTASTDSSSQASVDFTMGLEPASVTASIGGSSATVSFSPAPLPEWELINEEGIVDVSITANEPMTGLATGQTLTLTAHVTYDTWRTERSRISGAERTSNTGSAPAIGAPISFMVEQGDGTLGTQSTPATNNNGDVTVTFTMGADESCQVKATASYAGADSWGYADLFHAPWTYVRTEKKIEMTLTVAPGTPAVTAMVTQTTSEVWQSGTTIEIRPAEIGPALYAEVDFVLNGTNSSITPTTALTNIDGTATATYSIQDPEMLQASATFSGMSCNAEAILKPGGGGGMGWEPIDTGESLDISLADSSSTKTVTATVTLNTWENWQKDGETVQLNRAENPLEGATVNFNLFENNGTVGTSSSLTETDGTASTTYTITADDQLVASASYEGGTGPLTVTNQIPVTAGGSGPGPGPGPGTGYPPLIPKEEFPGEVPIVEYEVAKIDVTVPNGDFVYVDFGVMGKPGDPERFTYYLLAADSSGTFWSWNLDLPEVADIDLSDMSREEAFQFWDAVDNSDLFEDLDANYIDFDLHPPTRSDPPLPTDDPTWSATFSEFESDDGNGQVRTTKGYPEIVISEEALNLSPNETFDTGELNGKLNSVDAAITPDFSTSSKEQFNAQCDLKNARWNQSLARCSGSRTRVRCRLVNWDKFEEGTHEVTLLLVTKITRYDPNTETTVDESKVEPRKFTMEAGKSAVEAISNVHDLFPSSIYATEVKPCLVSMDLLPVEIVQTQLASDGYNVDGGLVSTTTPRLARWLDAWESDWRIKSDFISSERDRVKIRVPSALYSNLAQGSTPIVKIECAGDTTRLEMTQSGGFYESEPFLLVADADDDLSYNGKAGLGETKDGKLNDQTIRAGHGHPIHLTFENTGSQSLPRIEIGKTRASVHTLQCELVYLSEDGTVPAPVKSDIEYWLQEASETFSQIGITLSQKGEVSGIAAPSEYWQAIQQDQLTYQTSRTVADEEQWFSAWIRTKQPSIGNFVRVFFVPVSIWRDVPTNDGPADVVGLQELKWAMVCTQTPDHQALTLAHEVAHYAGQKDHADGARNLMHPNMTNRTFDYLDGKRFQLADEKKIKDHLSGGN
ncbi:MAG: Ig-like domain-containing protein [Verrucomicrobiales bacterium]|nr:Ig-like domain-containing protein [Verrucomicrobiales bacterium]